MLSKSVCEVKALENVKLSSLVDATRHVFNVLGFVLHTAVIVVGLHTCLDFTPNGGTQLSAECAFLEKQQSQQFFIVENE